MISYIVDSNLISRHGTVVSGIIGATKGNNFCQVGVAYDATLFGE